jgi:hypothetical protein
MLSLGDKGIRFLWGQVKPFIRGKILFTPDTPASRSVILIGYCSLNHALIGRQGDPLPVCSGQALHQGQDSFHTRHASLQVSDSHWLLSLILALIGRQGDPLPVGPGQALHQGQDSLHTRHTSHQVSVGYHSLICALIGR